MADSLQSGRSLRSRHSSGEKKVTRSQMQTHANSQSRPTGGYVATQGRFKSKLTDTLKLKLTAQHPKSVPSKSETKKVSSKACATTPAVTITSTPTNMTVASVNGFSSVNSQFVPKFYSVYIGNLPADITKEQLEDHFKKTCHGGVKSIRIPKDKGSDKGRGYAYMEFKDRINFGIALRLHQTKLAGRRITVELSQPGKKNKRQAKNGRKS